MVVWLLSTYSQRNNDMYCNYHRLLLLVILIPVCCDKMCNPIMQTAFHSLDELDPALESDSTVLLVNSVEIGAVGRWYMKLPAPLYAS